MSGFGRGFFFFLFGIDVSDYKGLPGTLREKAEQKAKIPMTLLRVESTDWF